MSSKLGRVRDHGLSRRKAARRVLGYLVYHRVGSREFCWFVRVTTLRDARSAYARSRGGRWRRRVKHLLDEDIRFRLLTRTSELNP